jgi:flagellar biosynthesis protein FliR
LKTTAFLKAKQSNQVKPETRIVLAILLGLVVDLYSHLFFFPLLGKAQANSLLRYTLSIATVVLVGITVWKVTANLTKDHSMAIVRGGLFGGITGVLIGFIGPILLTPNSPQGPLLGVVFTIPIGFVLGLLGGALYGSRKTSNN